MFEWIEGNRAFTIAFGTITAGACLAVAIPTLWWYLPKHRRYLFSQRLDPRARLQLGFGLFAMAMAWTDALCRYIPHGQLGVVHPVFLITTVAIVSVLGTRVLLARTSARGNVNTHVGLPTWYATLAAFVAVPLSAVIQAFYFPQ